jgi:transposase
VRLRLTAGQRHDMVEASTLIENLSPEYVIADKGYDSAELRQQIRRQKARPVIPGRKGTRRRHDKTRYRNRNVIERFFNLLKHDRRVATRYDKTARNYLGFVQFAAIALIL